MAITTTTYTADGIQQSFSIGFAFVTSSQILVKTNGTVENNQSVEGNQVIFLAIPNAGTEIEISRVTSTVPYVTFSDKTFLDPDDLDIMAQQPLQSVEELANEITDFTQTPGPEGPQGIQGPPGVGEGTSTLLGLTDTTITSVADGEILVFSTTSGTWENADAALSGADGADGPEGPQGIQGLPGIDGPQGPEGLQGGPGTNGTNGTNGEDGPAGPIVDLQGLIDVPAYTLLDGSKVLRSSTLGALSWVDEPSADLTPAQRAPDVFTITGQVGFVPSGVFTRVTDTNRMTVVSIYSGTQNSADPLSADTNNWGFNRTPGDSYGFECINAGTYMFESELIYYSPTSNSVQSGTVRLGIWAGVDAAISVLGPGEGTTITDLVPEDFDLYSNLTSMYISSSLMKGAKSAGVYTAAVAETLQVHVDVSSTNSVFNGGSNLWPPVLDFDNLPIWAIRLTVTRVA